MVLKRMVNGVETLVSPEEEETMRAEWQYNKSEQAKQQTKTQLQETDADMARAVEDLVDLLVSKGILTESEIPIKTYEKLQERRNLRRQIE